MVQPGETGKGGGGKGGGGRTGNGSLRGKELAAFNEHCCARVRHCVCGYRWPKDPDRLSKDQKLADRRKDGFDLRRLGVCPECGRPRQLCNQKAVKGKSVCRMHGGPAGRKPAIPDLVLDEETLAAIAVLEEAKDKSLEREFYKIKHFIQKGLASYDPDDPNKLAFAERAVALYERAVSIQERQARLRLLEPPDAGDRKLDFNDPRVALLVKERLTQAHENAVQGLIAMFTELALRNGVLDMFVGILPDRFREYDSVRKALAAYVPIEEVVPVPVENFIVAGGPGTGKSTHGDGLSSKPRRTDDLMDMEWEAASDQIYEWFSEPGPWVVEGVRTVHALRKWIERRDDPIPATVIYLSGPKRERDPGEIVMAKGIETVWNEILPELQRRGTLIRVLP